MPFHLRVCLMWRCASDLGVWSMRILQDFCEMDVQNSFCLSSYQSQMNFCPFSAARQCIKVVKSLGFSLLDCQEVSNCLGCFIDSRQICIFVDVGADEPLQSLGSSTGEGEGLPRV